MSIKKYTNIEQINNNSQNEGKFLQAEDLFIVNQNQIEDTDFGDCKYDVMEVSVYDVNNNLLPQTSGNKVAYIKTSDIKNYLYQITNRGGNKELAIDIEKLLNTLGFSNGIFKVNINFVRNSVGSENELERVWIQEISPSREEIRIVPLKVTDTTINQKNIKEFNNLNVFNADFKYYKKNILDSLDKFEMNSLTKIDDIMVNKFGKDFVNILRKDFGIRDFSEFRTRIFQNFRDSIKNWLNNKHYDITQSNFGKPSEVRFEDCDKYDFTKLLAEVQSILNNCISSNIKTLKRRNVSYNQLPKEFAVVELRKQIQDNLIAFNTYNEIKRNVFTTDSTKINVGAITQLPPIVEVIEKKVIPPVVQPTPVPVIPTPAPIKIEAPVIAPEPTPTPTPTPIAVPIENIETGGSSGGGYIDRDYGRNYGREQVFQYDMIERENIK
jgi:hypothetical protein